MRAPRRRDCTPTQWNGSTGLHRGKSSCAACEDEDRDGTTSLVGERASLSGNLGDRREGYDGRNGSKHFRPAEPSTMWRAFFWSIGMFACLVGGECLVIE